MYDLGVDAYVDLWSPVILPPAQAVVHRLELPPGARVLDVGTGSGALVPTLDGAAPRGTTFGLDPSGAMLDVACRTTSVLAVQGDALSLPIRSESVDAVLFAYVLFHVSDPAAAMREATRVLARDGRVGSVTWGRDDPLPANDAWSDALTEAGAPPLPPAKVDAGLDTVDAVHALLTGASLCVTDVWTVELRHRWDRSAYWRLVTGAGVHRMRLRQLCPSERAGALEHARRRLDGLPPEAFAWSGEVVCAVASLGSAPSPTSSTPARRSGRSSRGHARARTG